MSLGIKILIGVVIVLVIVVIVLYFLGKRAEKKQDEQKKQMEAMAQTMSMLIIDKKRMKLRDAGFPAVVMEQMPKYARRVKFPVVKAKVGPKVTTLLCDEAVFPNIPVKKEVKAVVSGLYITDVKGIRGPLEQPKKKPGFMQRMRMRASQTIGQGK